MVDAGAGDAPAAMARACAKPPMAMLAAAAVVDDDHLCAQLLVATQPTRWHPVDAMSELTSFDPATKEVVGTVTITTEAEVHEAIARSRAAAPAWAALGARRRAEILLAAADEFRSREQEIAKLMTREMGKPLAQAVAEVGSCADGLAHELEDIVRALEPDELQDERTRTVIYHDPLGVCAAITPWNFPFSMPHWLVLPALATGNTVLLKPSELTPLTGQAYADILMPLCPEGVLQVIHGADQQGRALVSGDVDLIAFTGSRETGKKILSAASAGLKRVILELGGKDPLIVLEDADLARAAKFAASNSFRNSGQVCVSTERIFVPKDIANEFVGLLANEAATYVVGNGLDASTKVGPMVSVEQRDHVLAQVDDALARGATLVGGEKPKCEDNFVPPMILTGVTEEMDIAHEETFGPVACVTTVDNADEAVALANSGRYGLGAVVFGGDDTQTEAIARRLQAGMIGINRSVGGAQGSPWVGARESGYGYHGSRDGHRQFTQTRIVSRRR